MHDPELSKKLQVYIPAARAELGSIPIGKDFPLPLYLLNSDYPQHQLTADEMLAIMDYPAYWAFCWASGQVMAQFLTANPEWVEGKRVLDFGCGSGVVAIAAAKAGAASVVACDIDEDALAATCANAKLNEVELELQRDFNAIDFTAAGQAVDLIVVADVLYDRSNLAWLDRFIDCAEKVLVADSRVKDFSHSNYELIDQAEATTIPDLSESDEFRVVSIYYGERSESK